MVRAAAVLLELYFLGSAPQAGLLKSRDIPCDGTANLPLDSVPIEEAARMAGCGDYLHTSGVCSYFQDLMAHRKPYKAGHHAPFLI